MKQCVLWMGGASLLGVLMLSGCGDPSGEIEEYYGTNTPPTAGVVPAPVVVDTNAALALGELSTAQGYRSQAYGYASHAQGLETRAIGNASHAEGAYSVATGIHSHAEGQTTRALGINSHAENYQAEAGAKNSHAGGMWTIVHPEHTNAFLHAAGKRENTKQSQFPNTAHFDRLYLFEAANDHSNSVLARWQNDLRYGRGGLTAGVGNRSLTNTATIGGGYFNTAGGFGTYVGGGMENYAEGDLSTIAGGWINHAAGWGAAVGGGATNRATGLFATVPGGRDNEAAGAYSLAAGQRAGAYHDGTFVWADGQDRTFGSTGPGQFLIRAAGGVGIGTNKPAATLDVHGDGRFLGGVRFPPQGDISMGSFTNGP